MVTEVDEADVCEASHDLLGSLLFLRGCSRIPVLAEVNDGDTEVILDDHPSTCGGIPVEGLIHTSTCVANVLLKHRVVLRVCAMDQVLGAEAMRLIEGNEATTSMVRLCLVTEHAKWT